MPRIIETDLSIFEVDAEVLVNPVNCVGVMGAGLAKEFAWRYPEMLKEYQSACRKGELKVGRIHTHKENEKCIVSFPTKNRWQEKSEYAHIDTGMRTLAKFLANSEYRKVAIPRLGCGLGGLNWGTVRLIAMRYIELLPDDFTVYFFEAKNQ